MLRARCGSSISGLLRRWRCALAYEQVTAPCPDITSSTEEPQRGIIIHGLLGAGRNWRSLSKSLANEAAVMNRRDWELMLVDLRNHGASAALNIFEPPHDIQAAAQDLIDLGWPVFVAGHSLGGKVALEYVRLLTQEPEAEQKLPKQVWILDSQLGPVSPYLPANQQVDKIIAAIQSIPLPIPSRKWLYTHIRSEMGMSLKVAHWLGSNLEGHPTGPMRWMFNVEGAAEMYASYKKSSCWDIVKHPPKGTFIHIVRAEKSERWNSELIHELHSAVEHTQERAKVYVLENAGHWVHADNPEGLLKLVVPSLRNI